MKRSFRFSLAISAIVCTPLFFGCRKNEEPHSDRQEQTPQTTEITENSIYNLSSEWRDQKGRTVMLKDLAGKVRVATMFYSSCDYACPKTIQDMKTILKGLPDDQKEKVGMTLFSFDPVRDTPRRLDTVAKDMTLGEQWTLLTSTEAAAEELGAALDIQYKDLETGEFSHSNTILILNSNGEIVHRQQGVGSNPAESIEALSQLLNKHK